MSWKLKFEFEFEFKLGLKLELAESSILIRMEQLLELAMLDFLSFSLSLAKLAVAAPAQVGPLGKNHFCRQLFYLAPEGGAKMELKSTHKGLLLSVVGPVLSQQAPEVAKPD